MSKEKQTLLVVDDAPAIIDILLAILGEDFTVRVATTGAAALDSVKHDMPDMILLDVMMPVMDGLEVCRRLKADPASRDIPIIFLTAMDEAADEARGMAMGAVDYIIKPFKPAIVNARVRSHLELKKHRDQLEELVKQRTNDLERTQEATISSMALLAEYRDPETGGHIQRTKHYVRSMAEALSAEYPNELTPVNVKLLYLSAPLHDIGKVAIADSILLKPGKLTSEEFIGIQLHTLIGSEVIRKTEAIIGENSFLRHAREIAEFHHECWNGAGYPHGLKGEEIPLSARLMAIADIYDALISARAYKPAFSHQKACDIIINGDGRTLPEHFSPIIAKAFQAVHQEWSEIAAKFKD